MAILGNVRTKETELEEARFNLAHHLSRVLYCSTCGGKGTVFNPRGKDKTCNCRHDAKLALIKDGS